MWIYLESEAAAKAAAAHAPRSETDAVTRESFTIGKVVAPV